MYVQVVPVRREGRLIPGWQKGPTTVFGWLSMREELEPDLRRHIKVARVRGFQARDVIRPLINADFLYVDAYWSIAGTEKVPTFPDGHIMFAQNWVAHPVSEIECRRWEDRELAQGRVPGAQLEERLLASERAAAGQAVSAGPRVTAGRVPEPR